MQDILRISNMVFHAYIGQENYEQEVGHRYEVDVELYLDLTTAGQTDNIQDTIDVRKVYRIVEEIMMEGDVHLVEAITERIAHAFIEKLNVPEVMVRVRKPNASVGGICDGFEVEVTRTA